MIRGPLERDPGKRDGEEGWRARLISQGALLLSRPFL